MTNGIEWRHIAGSPQYEISEAGVVRRREHGKTKGRIGDLVKPSKLPSGYWNIKLTVNGKHKMFYVHRLVAMTFHGIPCDKSLEVAHLDGDKDNNHKTNLSWVTHKENVSHKKIHGTNLRIDPEIITIIRRYHSEGYGTTELAYMFDIGKTTTYRILNGKGVYS